MNVLEELAVLVAERLGTRDNVPRLMLTKSEAARSLGISVDHFDRHVAPDLKVKYSGRKVLVPLAELERWADAAAPTLKRETR